MSKENSNRFSNLFFKQKHIAELEDLAQSIIDAESADPSVRVLMYHAWLHTAKRLKKGDI